MFTTTKQATHAVMQQASALGLAAVVTLSILAGVNGLSTTPTPDSLLAAGAAPTAQAKVAANG